jgi:hypothetical protein
MNVANHRFDALAARVTLGDSTAAEQLRRELEPQLVHIVRRTIRSGTGASPLARRILAEARQVAGSTRDHPDDREWLIGQVARGLCASMVGRLRQGPAPHQPLRETVRN